MAGPEAIVVAGPEEGAEAGPAAGPEAGLEARSEVGAETGREAAGKGPVSKMPVAITAKASTRRTLLNGLAPCPMIHPFLPAVEIPRDCRLAGSEFRSCPRGQPL